MPNQNFPLQLNGGAQVLASFGASTGSHRLALTFNAAPSAGTALIEYKLLGSPLWVVLQAAAALAGGYVADNVDGPVELFRVTFSGLVGGSGPALWVSTQETAEFPLRLLTDGGDGPTARLRTDNGQTGFFARRMWEFLYEFSTLAADPVTFRFIIPCNFIVHHSALAVDQGGVTWRTYSAAQGTPGGVFATEAPFVSVNAMNEQPPYDFLSSIAFGGTFTPTPVPAQNPITVLRVRTAGATAQQSSVGGDAVQEKGRASGTYYGTLARMTGVSGDCKGTLTLVIEERPA